MAKHVPVRRIRNHAKWLKKIEEAERKELARKLRLMGKEPTK